MEKKKEVYSYFYVIHRDVKIANLNLKVCKLFNVLTPKTFYFCVFYELIACGRAETTTNFIIPWGFHHTVTQQTPIMFSLVILSSPDKKSWHFFKCLQAACISSPLEVARGVCLVFGVTTPRAHGREVFYRQVWLLTLPLSTHPGLMSVLGHGETRRAATTGFVCSPARGDTISIQPNCNIMYL